MGIPFPKSPEREHSHCCHGKKKCALPRIRRTRERKWRSLSRAPRREHQGGGSPGHQRLRRGEKPASYTPDPQKRHYDVPEMGKVLSPTENNPNSTGAAWVRAPKKKIRALCLRFQRRGQQGAPNPKTGGARSVFPKGASSNLTEKEAFLAAKPVAGGTSRIPDKKNSGMKSPIAIC